MSNDIKYVCLSDMHFGADNSLLTDLVTASSNQNPLSASPVLVEMVKCLRHVIGDSKPTLILNGDILEMALSSMNQAAMVFERFIELIMPKGKELFSEIIFIPGNHDHHLWEVARETQYVNYIADETKPGDVLNKPWHVTRLLKKEGVELPITYFLTRLIRRYKNLNEFNIYTAYPNYGVFDKKTNKCVLFHHGHYIESLYMLMSKLRTLLFPEDKMPDNIMDIEEENFAWIDFFWSAMGRSGKMGENVGLVYDKMQDKDELKKLLDNLAKGIAKNYGRKGWIADKAEEEALSLILNWFAKKFGGTEKGQTEEFLSKDAEKGLRSYVDGPLYKQLSRELKGTDPFEVTFVFGHTHKPYADDENFGNYPQWVNVYNSGGWVVESDKPEPKHGGAVILVDKDLNTVSLRMYNETAQAGDYNVYVENATHAGENPNPLYVKIEAQLKPDSSPWSNFSAAVERAIAVRHRNMKARIHQKL